MADWSMLPCDILGQIALKLDEIEPFLYFSVVCHSWNCASSLIKSQWKTKTTLMPWMLLAENTNENPDCRRKCYNLSSNKFYQLKLPETFGARCWGSRYGWVVTQNYDCMSQAHLFNPLTKVRITSLPSLLTLPHTPKKAPKKKRWYFDHFVVRFVVLKMPKSQHPPNNGDDDDDGDLLIAAIYGEFAYSAFARPGDKAWTYLDDTAEDVFCWGDVIYIVRPCGALLYCDIHKRFGGDHLNTINKDVEVLHYVPGCIQKPRGLDKVTLLGLCGDLLMVVRQKVCNDNNEYTTVCFRVYRLDNKIKLWVRIKDIGNFAIFVGNNSSMLVPVSATKNWMKNCIYFTDDETDYFRRTPGYGGKDMGVYNLRSGDIKQFYEGDDTRSSFCPPMFFVPWLK